MSEVVIVRKRNAKTDPPEHEWDVLTDRGCAYYGRRTGDGAWWRFDADKCHDVSVQPAWWIDVRPSEGEPLTYMMLKRIFNAAYDKQVRANTDDLNAFRAALDALTRKDDT